MCPKSMTAEMLGSSRPAATVAPEVMPPHESASAYPRGAVPHKVHALQRLMEGISKSQCLQRCREIHALPRLVEVRSNSQCLQKCWGVYALQRVIELRSKVTDAEMLGSSRPAATDRRHLQSQCLQRCWEGHAMQRLIEASPKVSVCRDAGKFTPCSG